MTPAGSPLRVSRWSSGWWLVAAVLLLVATGFLVVGLSNDQPDRLAEPVGAQLVPPAAQLAPPAAVGAAEPAPPSGTAGPAVTRSVPVALRVPAMGVSVPVSELGLNPDKTVQVPTDFQKVGWFQLGPSPGQVGSAVILGHVDSYRGPAVFYRLRSLQTGDRVDVDLADGMVAHFVVTMVATYSKQDFPASQVYGSRGYSTLQLVTCGGKFDTQTRSYLSNVVAYTSLVAITPAIASQK